MQAWQVDNDYVKTLGMNIKMEEVFHASSYPILPKVLC